MTKAEQYIQDTLPTVGTLYIHPFFREDLTTGDCWYDYVVSTSPDLSEGWRHIKEEEDTVLDYSSDLCFIAAKYHDSILVRRKDY